jgi:hypothetical protein
MAKAPKVKSVRLHHWLVAGKVTFQTPDREGVGSFEHNTVVTNTKPHITANMIGEAQRRIQIELFQQLGDPNVKVVNVHMQTVNYLGAMTKEEFYTPPPEQQQEASADETASAPAKPDPIMAPAAKDAFTT